MRFEQTGEGCTSWIRDTDQRYTLAHFFKSCNRYKPYPPYRELRNKFKFFDIHIHSINLKKLEQS